LLLSFFIKSPKQGDANVTYVGEVVDNLEERGQINEQAQLKRGAKESVISWPEQISGAVNN
jgi:hypothetical protein